MAQASLDDIQVQYYCHKCTTKICPTLPDYKCPQCHNGFIEEYTRELENIQTNNVAMPDFTQLFSGASFLRGIESRPTTSSSYGRRLWGRDEDAEEDETIDGDDAGDEKEGDSDDTDNETQTGRDAGRDAGREEARRRASRVPPALYRLPPTRRRRAMNNSRTSVGDSSGGAGGSILHLLELFSLATGGSGNMSFGSGLLHGNPEDYAWGSEGLDNVITRLLNQVEDTGPLPAPKEEIQAIPDTVITPEDIVENRQCNICLEDYQLHEDVKQLPCKHIYHVSCIVQWLQLHNSCPVCRTNLSGQSTVESELPSGRRNVLDIDLSLPVDRDDEDNELDYLFSTGDDTTTSSVDENSSGRIIGRTKNGAPLATPSSETSTRQGSSSTSIYATPSFSNSLLGDGPRRVRATNFTTKSSKNNDDTNSNSNDRDLSEDDD